MRGLWHLPVLLTPPHRHPQARLCLNGLWTVRLRWFSLLATPTALCMASPRVAPLLLILHPRPLRWSFSDRSGRRCGEQFGTQVLRPQGSSDGSLARLKVEVGAATVAVTFYARPPQLMAIFSLRLSLLQRATRVSSTFLQSHECFLTHGEGAGTKRSAAAGVSSAWIQQMRWLGPRVVQIETSPAWRRRMCSSWSDQGASKGQTS